MSKLNVAHTMLVGCNTTCLDGNFTIGNLISWIGLLLNSNSTTFTSYVEKLVTMYGNLLPTNLYETLFGQTCVRTIVDHPTITENYTVCEEVKPRIHKNIKLQIYIIVPTKYIQEGRMKNITV